MLPELRDIARMRKMLGLTQTDLARFSGVSQSLIAKIEAGKTDPSYSKAKALFDGLERLRLKETKRASDVMAKDVISIESDDPVEKAVKLMYEHAISQMPVFEGGRVIGSVSEKILVKHVSEGLSIDELLKDKVGKVMGDPFPTVAEDTPVELLSSILGFYQAVLVTKKDKVMGIVTRSDLLKP
ncbi:MAG: CBS domain-containing protein [Candidatus Geothermarchaeales archaeon]